MQFQRHDRPSPYFNAREQRRLLLMMGMLTLVVVGIEFAAQPSTWYWLTGPPQGGEAGRTGEVTQVDARLPQPVDEPPAGGFLLAKSDAEPAEIEGGEAAQITNDPGRLDPQIFSTVRDDTLGLRSSERGAYFQGLAQVKKMTDREISQYAVDDVTFAQMFLNPDDYRGRLITIRGRVKRLYPVAAVENDFGIETIYQAWILTPDSGDNPLLLHCTEITDGMPTGENLDLACWCTGYFFKKYAYTAVHGLHSTTLLLGGKLHWTPPPPQVSDLGLAPYILGVVIAMGAVLLLVLWRYSVSDRRFRELQLESIKQLDLSGLSDAEDEETG